ncbi:MAG: glycosyltransferase family 4 protein [Planctomycetes bacterium]|nr:glycosyltransferase family 4 protein [Planctomycetota bacterium]
MSGPPFRIASITAGAGGMFCGSCMHDNTLARALCRKPGVECVLVPTYTPIRTDDEDVSLNRVFLGGLTVYLEQIAPWLRFAPRFVTRAFDQPRLLRWIASRAVGTHPKKLGALTLSMLSGTEGRQRVEVRRLCRWLADDLRPDVVLFSNILIGGCIPELKRILGTPVFATLQGDDIFLDGLAEDHRARAVEAIRRLVPLVDGFLTHSRFYAGKMGRLFDIPPAKRHIIPLGIDPFEPPRDATHPPTSGARPLAIGYLARLAPEKGLHQLTDAFLLLKGLSGMESTRLEIAGWLGAHHRGYADAQFGRLRAAGWGDHFTYSGTIDRDGKRAFLSRIDLLSVPTVYPDPKGLYVLEAMAMGVPVVQPAHGAFPEWIEASGAGELVEPGDPKALAEAWHRLLRDPARRAAFAEAGRNAARGPFHADRVADRVLEMLRGTAARAC